MAYRVYDNWTWKKAVIHHDKCGSCNYGHGVHTGKGRRNSMWIPDKDRPAIPTLDKARLVAEATGHEVTMCGHCCKSEKAT
jgi:hypothetical protein